MNNYVPTKETCQRLAELVELDTEFYWQTDTGDVWELEHGKYEASGMTNLPAPLLSELLEVIPKTIESGYTVSIMPTEFGWTFYYEAIDKKDVANIQHKRPVEAACRLLIWLIEEGHVKPDEL